MLRRFVGVLVVAALGGANTAAAYDYDNAVRNSALMAASCERDLENTAGTPAMKRENCVCFLIGITASVPSPIEVRALVEGKFVAELIRLNGVRPMGWHPAIRKCFR